LEIPAELAGRLRAASRALGVTPFMALLGGFSALLARYSGQEDFALGAPVATRSRLETEGMVGLLVNTLVLRASLAGDPSAGDLLHRLREVVLGAHAHQDLPFERLVEELQPERALDRTPLFQVMLASFVAADEAAPGFPGLRAEPLEVDNGAAKFDLTALLREEGERLHCALVYRRDLFDAATIDRLGGHYLRLLEGIAADPGTRISELPLLTAAEADQLAGEWSSPPVELPRDWTVHELFAEQARRTPDRPAVVCRDERLTYAELQRRAGGLARTLRGLGVGPEVLVGLCAERSVDGIVGILGVLEAGGAYLPLDPEYPRERLAFLLEDSRAPVLLTQERLLPRLPDGGARVVLLDRLPEWEGEAHAPAAGPENAAYVIYTSGSTGQPKGTLIEHRSVVNLAHALHRAVYAGRPAPLRVGVNASLAFDASVKQIVQLLYGHTLNVLPEEVRRDGEAFVAHLREHPLDVLDCTPAQLELLLAGGYLEEEWSSPAVVLVGGEAIGEALWRRLAASRRTLFYNVYGPTECTVDATACAVGPEAERPALGRPLANVRLRLLDRRLAAVPPGVPGEICIAGAGLARGYLHRPGLTAARFVPDPAAAEPGARMYRTGDLARYRSGGSGGRLEYLGRADHQVKVRGVRIEPGEIEARLELHPGVDRAVVLLREDAPGDRRLVAYVRGSESLADAGLRLWLRQALPEPMIPAAFVRLDELPLSAHGKVDRGRLPRPEAPLAREAVAPRTLLEASLARIWGELLRLDRVGVRDNFFELGGHSLLALQLAARIRQGVGVEVPVRTVFEQPTIEALAEILERSPARPPGPPEPVLAASRRRGGRDLGQLLSEVSSLSPEEVRRRLAERDRPEGR
ncbi:MAG TPA: amino acid adenylation domain-containing protein, partial [Thermoanaerobaculia bacterium]|nr:amino acid adenylation domain-containing protein [Thermoanaerobaculia bacterium]